MNFYECISRLNSIYDQYKIALFAFDLYQKKEEAKLNSILEKRKAEFLTYIETVKKEKLKNKERFDESAFKNNYGGQFFMHEGLLSYPEQQADQLKNSIRQNSLITMFSTFEIFLTDLLRHILANRPRLLNLNRKVEIGRLITVGTEKLILEEVERQIYSIDRKSIFDKANYFKTHLKICWDKDSNNTKVINRINDLRNDIVHKDTALTVNEEDLKETLKTCKEIVYQLMKDSMKHYNDIIFSLIRKKET